MKASLNISSACIFICLLLAVFQIHGAVNTHKTDSLERVLQACKTPEEKVPILLQLSDVYFNTNQPAALSYALKAYQAAESSDDEPGMLHAMLKMIGLYYMEADYTRLLDYAVKSKELAEKLGMKQELAESLDALGVIYDDFGDKDKSSEYYFQVLKLTEELKDLRGIAQATSRIGVLYYRQKNYQKALEYLTLSLNYSRKSNSPDGIASNLNSIANIYSDQKDYQRALKTYMEGLVIAEKTDDLRLESSISLSLGTTYLKMQNFTLSKQYFQRALTIFQKLHNQLRITKCQVQFGEYYLATHDYQKGFEYASEALKTSKELGYIEVGLQAAMLLHRLSLATNDTLRAYRFAILEGQLKDSIAKGEQQKSLTKIEAQYQFDKQQIAKTIAQQRRDYIMIIFIILLLSAIIILFLIWNRQKDRAKNAILEKENLEKELEFKNKEMVINVMSLMKKNEMLADLSEKLIKIDHEATTQEGKDTIAKVAKELQKGQEEEIWKEFSMRFKEVHGEFYDKLLAKYPALGPNDLKLCAFLRLNMSSKDIAALTGQRISSLETARYRLRQKLGISNADVNLITFLSQF